MTAPIAPTTTCTTVHADDDLPLTVPALLGARAAQRGEAAFVVCDDDVVTYAEAERRSAALARGLLAIGVGRGTPVGVLHPNGSEFVVSALGAARIGAVVVPLSTFSTGPELATLLRGADVRVLLSARSYRNHDYRERVTDAVPGLDLAADPPVLAPSLPALRHVAFAEPGARVGGGGPEGAVAPAWTTAALLAAGDSIDPAVLEAAEREVTPADRLVIVHTSGSTSEPKGVITRTAR
jgi:acyl-CoA synthetase (AMP-forming)/AMP-acid ligase II